MSDIATQFTAEVCCIIVASTIITIIFAICCIITDTIAKMLWG